jgi:hypothetical protein
MKKTNECTVEERENPVIPRMGFWRSHSLVAQMTGIT